MFSQTAISNFGGKLLSLYPLVLLAIVWEVAARLGTVPAIFLPAFSTVLAKLWSVTITGEAPQALASSLFGTVAGLAIAFMAGVGSGFLSARSAFARWLTRPLISIGFPMPKIALLPLFTLWFGIDHTSKVALVAATCFFPFFVAAQSAAGDVPARLLWAAQSLGTSKTALFTRVILPASVPSLVSGLRVCVPMGLITVFTSEMLTGGGIGERIILAQRFFETSTVFAYILLTVVVGYLLDDVLAHLQRTLKQ